MSAHSIFVTGTDTGIGKTTVSCGLMRALADSGLRVAALKLVETGVGEDKSGDDCAALYGQANAGQLPQHVGPYRFAAPAAPNVAARAEDAELSLEDLERVLGELPEHADISFIEGAGGLLVPINDELTFADLLSRRRLPVLVVVGSRLGAINHAALTFEVLARREIPTIGYVLNDLFAKDELQSSYALALKTNREEIARAAARYGIREVGHVPFLGHNSAFEPRVFAPLAKELMRLVCIKGVE